MNLARENEEELIDKLTNTLTIITTYTCTAECKECCFGCTPKVKGRLELSVIKKRIEEAKKSFPSLQLVVFTGGECFLLKEELYESIAFARKKGLLVRCVTNAYWGKTENKANEVAGKLHIAGVNEINISTGKDHQEYVPFPSVVNVSKALVSKNISTLVTIEQDTPESKCKKEAMANLDIRMLLEKKSSLFSLMSNSWMPFTHDAEKRASNENNKKALDVGCEQIFGNAVITAHDQLAGCCGLALEHIPEMKLGNLNGSNLKEMYSSQLDDFMKIWLHIEGPYGIVKRMYGENAASNFFKGVNHICHSCAILHHNEDFRKKILNEWQNHVSRVMQRFMLKLNIIDKKKQNI